ALWPPTALDAGGSLPVGGNTRTPTGNRADVDQGARARARGRGRRGAARGVDGVERGRATGAAGDRTRPATLRPINPAPGRRLAGRRDGARDTCSARYWRARRGSLPAQPLQSRRPAARALDSRGQARLLALCAIAWRARYRRSAEQDPMTDAIPRGRLRRTAKVGGLVGGQAVRGYATKATNLTRSAEGRQVAVERRQIEEAEKVVD